jgi:hypothetical protein
MLIIINAFLMGVEADDIMTNAIHGRDMAVATQSSDVTEQSQGKWFLVADILFAVVFSVELLLRLLVHEIWFWFGDGWVFNGVDTLVVVFAWVEITVTSSKLPPLRLFRVIRVLRSLRVVRAFRYFKELRLVVLSLLHSLRPLMWCFLVFGIIIFVFAIFFMQVIALGLVEEEPDVSVVWARMLLPMFSTSRKSMISLFSYVSGGTNWEPHYNAFAELGTIVGAVFVCYIVLIFLGVLNVIAAVFVEVAMSKAKGDHQLALAEEYQSQQEVAHELIKVFHLIDVDDTSHIVLNDWSAFIRSEVGKDFLTFFEVDAARALSLFKMLDLDDDGEVQIQEFVVGFMRMHGFADKLQQHELETALHMNKMLLRQSLEEMQRCTSAQTDIFARLDLIRREIKSGLMKSSTRSEDLDGAPSGDTLNGSSTSALPVHAVYL